jgi:anti-sigma regulatory factor (Ser/Thr protein kinase)
MVLLRGDWRMSMSTLLKLDLTAPSRVELVDDLCETVSHCLSTLGFAEDDVYALDLSTREAVVNAMKHGNGFDASLPVSVKVEVSDDDCTIRIADSGKNPKAVPESRSGLFAPNGRGVVMMKALMDSVEFARSGGRFEVVLRKRIQTARAAQAALR